MTMKKGNIRCRLLPVAVFAVLSIIILAFGSNNSFLYKFNEYKDINCFMTTVRCMARGDVLYRDVYEQKGPILYFLYLLGYRIFPDSFIGFYWIECVFFAVYGFFMYRISGLYTDKEYIKYGSAFSVMMMTAFNNEMIGGGQCEELALPFIAMSLFFMLRHFKKRYPKRIRCIEVIAIGIGFALTFWMKYTVTGAFAGIVLAIIVIQIRDKKFGEIFLYAGEFIIGTLIGTLPVIIYFLKHNAFDSLWEVYFYNLIFRYSNHRSPLLNSSFEVVTHYLTVAEVLMLLIFADKKTMTVNEKIMTLFMIVFSSLGIGASYTFEYTFLPLRVYGVIIITVICNFLRNDLADVIGSLKLAKLIDSTMVSPAKKLLEKIREKNLEFVAVLTAVIMLSAFPVVSYSILIAAMLSFVINKANGAIFSMMDNRKLSNFFFIAEYLMIIGLISIGMNDGNLELLLDEETILLSGTLTLILVIADNKLKKRLAFNIDAKSLAADYRKHMKKCNFALTILVIAVISYIPLANFFVNNRHKDILRPAEEYPVYVFSEYIKKNGIGSPVIINYNCLDMGIYYATGTYPPERYFCSYNIDLDDIEDIYTEYVNGGKADFLFSLDRVEPEHYKLVKIEDACFLYERIGETDISEDQTEAAEQ